MSYPFSDPAGKNQQYNVQYASLPSTGYGSPESVYYGSPQSSHGQHAFNHTSTPQSGYFPPIPSSNSGFSMAPGYRQVGEGNAVIHPERPGSAKSWICLIFGTLMALLWAVPAVALLVLNFTSYIIGASAWCPGGNCPGPGFSGDSYGFSASTGHLNTEYDLNNRNLLGGLLFAAKALEVWFVFVAVGLVYLITSLLARSEHGIPIGFMLTYVEFSDLLNVLNPSLWSSAVPTKDLSAQYKKKRRTIHFYLFALFAGFMCVLCNVMGPSVAVLILPTLHWRETDQVYEQRFGSVLSADPPFGDDAIPGCNAINLTEKAYECSYIPYAYSLDAMIDYMISQINHNMDVESGKMNFDPPYSLERSLSLRFNITKKTSVREAAIYWAPNRQVVRKLSEDLAAFYNTPNDPNSPYKGYNNSLQTILQRQGPVIAVDWNVWWGEMTTTVVDDDREVRCYHNWWWTSEADTYVKCFRVGEGWNSSNTLSTFTAGAEQNMNDSSIEVVQVNAYASDKAVYFKSSFTPDVVMQPCLPNGTVPSDLYCDWDALFARDPPAGIPANMTNQTRNAFIFENGVMDDPSAKLVVEAYLSVGFATYSVDTAESSPTRGMVQIDRFPEQDEIRPIIMNSAWLLASWSVSDGSDAQWWRISTRQLQHTISRLHAFLVSDEGLSEDNLDTNLDLLYWYLLSLNSGLEAASLLPWSLTDPDVDGLRLAADDRARPTLGRNLRRQVWAYGLETRSSKLGVAVLLAGIVCVVARVLLAVLTRVRHRSPAEILIAGMKHRPRGEFDAAGHSARLMERVRFEMRDDSDYHMHFAKR